MILKNLPSDPRKIAPLPSRVSTVLDHTNPGSSSPASLRTPRMSVDQTRTVSIASASAVNSDGDSQQKNLNAGQQGVTVTAGSSSGQSFSGDRQHTWALANIDQGTQIETGAGLAKDVFPGNQNVSTPILHFAKPLPTAVNRDGGASNKIKGVSVPVMIR